MCWRGCAEADPTQKNESDVSGWIHASGLSDAHKPVALAFWESLVAGFAEPNADLLYFAHYIYPVPFANELVGDLHRMRGELPLALQVLSTRSAGWLGQRGQETCSIAPRHRRSLDAADVCQSSQFLDKLSPDLKLVVLAKEGRWRELPGTIKELHFKGLGSPAMFIAIGASCIWLLIAMHAAQPRAIISFRTVGPLIALIVGLISSSALLVAILWQEQVINIRKTDVFTDTMLIYLAGVAPREELVKLVFVLPFVPVFLIRKERLEMLVISGCVGLGFAIGQNVQGFANGISAIAFGRFLSATFFHFAATGLLGLALSELLLQPLKKSAAFGLTAAGVVFANGCYHAFTAVEQFSALSFISMISFLLLALALCRKLAGLRDASREDIAVSATFVIGVALLVVMVLVCAAIEIGFLSALLGLAATVFTVSIAGLMVFWQLSDALSESEANRARPYAQ